MRKDIVLAGVGGQGVLTVAAIIAEAARRESLQVKQGEVHGMSQRGGAVMAFLRLSDAPVHSDLVAIGSADLVLSLEPVESLRYLEYLKQEDGLLITAGDPVLNIPEYPEMDELLMKLHSLPHALVVQAGGIAMAAGSPKAVNVALVGAASHHLPIRPETIEDCLREGFAPKGDRIVRVNLAAFRGGRKAVAWANA